MLEATIETLYMTLVTTLFAYVIGLPLGFILILTQENGLYPKPKFHQALSLVINFLRSIPFIILLIMVMSVTRFIVGTTIGATAMIVPLSIAAFPFVSRLVESSLKEVDQGLIEAVLAMGATNGQIMKEVYLKEALPSILNNLAIALSTILGYSAMAGFVGGGGLGALAINYGYYRNSLIDMIPSVIILIILVQIFQDLPTRLSKKINRRKK
ncbi:MAG: ABC transporter permease [Erysipelothrix sp.]|nr:ABC transporter permease [Erysipelothrix sp.]